MAECIPGTDIPKPTVKLVGEDGNAYSVLARVRKALRRAGASAEKVEEFLTEATKGDYDNVLATAMKWADVE